jgi:hypothetical protein
MNNTFVMYARQDRQNTYNPIIHNVDIQKYNNEIMLQIDEYRERNNSSPSYLKINKRALQILYYCQILYLHRADIGAAIIDEYAGLKVCPTDDIDINCVEVF